MHQARKRKNQEYRQTQYNVNFEDKCFTGYETSGITLECHYVLRPVRQRNHRASVQVLGRKWNGEQTQYKLHEQEQ
jgi:hypothetical protein